MRYERNGKYLISAGGLGNEIKTGRVKGETADHEEKGEANVEKTWPVAQVLVGRSVGKKCAAEVP